MYRYIMRVIDATGTGTGTGTGTNIGIGMGMDMGMDMNVCGVRVRATEGIGLKEVYRYIDIDQLSTSFFSSY